MYEEIKKQARDVMLEVLEQSKLQEGNVMVIGCSSSTVCGDAYGTNSNFEIAQAIFQEMYSVLKERGIYLAAQCCEHLNRAIITEAVVAEKQRQDVVNVIPQQKAGGSFATITYQTLGENAVAVEHIKADAGIDIGGVLIGMHLKEVAVPLALKNRKIGQANITAARTRPKFIGGNRAVYDDALK